LVKRTADTPVDIVASGYLPPLPDKKQNLLNERSDAAADTLIASLK
jgi:hypothetical protein